ncbi:MAG: S9 family peptidase [Pseudomonadota bacterium]
MNGFQCLRQRCVALGVLLAASVLAGCEVAPQHPSLKGEALPKLIPLRDFVANTGHVDNFRVSPNGQSLAWTAVRWLRDALVWRDANGREDYIRFRKSAPRPHWAADSRHLLYHHDPSGWENYHVFAVDTLTGETRDLTPYEGVKAHLGRVPSSDAPYVFINHNRRDNAVFDVYRVNVETGAEELVFENDGNALTMLLDDYGTPLVRVQQSAEARLLQVRRGDSWDTLLEADRFSALWPIELSRDGASVFLLTNIDTDKLVLQRLDFATGARTTMYAHDRVDAGGVVMGTASKQPLAITFEPDYPRIHFFNDRLATLFAPLLADQPTGLRILSLSRDERVGTALTYDATGATFYRIALDGGGRESGVERLAETAPRAFAEHLADVQAIEFEARDGMRLYGYLTLPKGLAKSALPTVLMVHGGPWARDRWGYHRVTQMLANRGYAVLQINYRGSSGYGRRYLFAGERQFAQAMQTDLLDGLDWAIEAGFTDPDRVAIMGGSYGGYATLVGMTKHPERFACGVDIVGISDLVSALENFPPYWKPNMHFWDRFVGDPKDATDRADMAARSPINFAANVTSPLLVVHGENDPRVRLAQSERMVAALREAGREVDYLVFPGEGHGFGHWKNQLTLHRRVEDFLAGCLGGRSSNFDFYELGSWAF